MEFHLGEVYFSLEAKVGVILGEELMGSHWGSSKNSKNVSI